jgi:heterodisulfide reductase subunit C
MRWDITEKALHSEFLRTVEQRSGENVSSCYQCGKCSGGCPVVADIELTPNRIIRMVQLGLEGNVLRSETVWCCAACGTCNGRCPIGIDIVHIMDVLREMALERRVVPPPGAAEVLMFYRSFLDCVKEFGRLNEIALMGSYNINSWHLFCNVMKAPWFIFKSKITIAPHKIKQIDRLKRAFERIEELERKK